MKDEIIEGIVTVIVALLIIFTCSVPIVLNYWKQDYEYRRAKEEKDKDEDEE